MSILMIFPVSGFGPLHFSLNVSTRPRRSEGTSFVGGQLDALRSLARRIIDTRGLLHRAFGETRIHSSRRIMGSVQGGGGIIARAESASALGLSTAATATTLVSTEEVNTTPTSFTPRVPAISGRSTTQVTVGGTYDGDQGDARLRFRFLDSGTVGVDTIRIRVRLATGGPPIETITFAASDPPDTVKVLSNGLTLSLSAGTTRKNDKFEVGVFQTVGGAVDPDKPLDGIGNDSPGLDPGQSVTPGSFSINGATIDIASGDTLNDVLAKINASAAGVTATFNSSTEKVELTHNTAGSAYQIVLGSDDTGFLAATKLRGANQVLGTDSDLQRALSQVGALGGISDGNFQINGVNFDVDTSTDTLTDIIGRINASGAGVTAAYDSVNDKLTVASKLAGVDLTLADGTSNFFAGVGITAGTISGAGGSPAGTGSRLVRDLEGGVELPGLLEELGKGLNELFRTAFDEGALGVQLPGDLLQNTITEVFKRVFDEEGGERLRTGLGIEFFFDDSRNGVVRIDSRRLKRATETKIELLSEFLAADDGAGRKGLLPALDEALEELGLSLVDRLDPIGSHGLIVDLRA